MLFKPEMIDAILAGKKTQTRRVVKADEWDTPMGGLIGGAVFTSTSQSSRLKWQVGRTYAIQPGRGKPSIGRRIRITSIRCEYLHDITEADALAEGVASVAEYRALWERINGAGSFDENPSVWVLTFELVKGGDV